MDEQPKDSTPNTNRLESIRGRALEAIVPMVDNLEETPARKFEIIMTAARYSDNDLLLDKALQSALAMDQGTPKIEALIDIVNEVNYRLTK